jgi:alkylhydroperoxidase/carboxymuconolactone decarboxylase family protein YurZ
MTIKSNSEGRPATGQRQETGPWDNTLDQMREWDPKWAEKSVRMAANPWTRGVLSRKNIELICVGLNAACTNLNSEATRHHLRAALVAGATQEEIIFVIQAASIPSIHSCSLGAPILWEEAKAAGVRPPGSGKKAKATPVCDQMKKMGQWNEAWDPIFDLDPEWTEAYFDMAARLITSGVMTAKMFEFLSIALDASITHMYVPGIRRHIRAALKLGATMEEIMEVLKLCVVQGIQACNLGLPILAEELERVGRRDKESG